MLVARICRERLHLGSAARGHKAWDLLQRVKMSSLEEPMTFEHVPSASFRRRSFTHSSSFDKPRALLLHDGTMDDARLSSQTDRCTLSHCDRDCMDFVMVERENNGSCEGLNKRYLCHLSTLCLCAQQYILDSVFVLVCVCEGKRESLHRE
ncbi:hypothetical protein L7F22_021945 [Adiantum nelumboides]|nr:hypothetical protein [Adiantum nelumboides]